MTGAASCVRNATKGRSIEYALGDTPEGSVDQ